MVKSSALAFPVGFVQELEITTVFEVPLRGKNCTILYHPLEKPGFTVTCFVFPVLATTWVTWDSAQVAPHMATYNAMANALLKAGPLGRMMQLSASGFCSRQSWSRWRVGPQGILLQVPMDPRIFDDMEATSASSG